MKKVPISERALVARINRRLAKEDEALNRCRENARGFDYFGRYYRLDLRRNQVVDSHVDPEELGREIKVLAEWECLAKD